MNSLAIEQGSSGDRSPVGFDGDSLQIFLLFEILLGSAAGSHAVDTVFRPPDVRYLRFAQPRRQLHKGIEYSLQIEWSPADDPQHLRRGGLLLQCVVQFAGMGGTATAHGLSRNAPLARGRLARLRVE